MTNSELLQKILNKNLDKFKRGLFTDPKYHWLKDLLMQRFPNLEFNAETLYLYVQMLNTPPICSHCAENFCKFKSFNKGYLPHCSSCGIKVGKQKSIQTCLAKYGTEYVTQTENFKQKREQTSITKYGVKHPSQSVEIKHKMENTYLEKYGVNNPAKSESVKLKTKKTVETRYGVEYAVQTQMAKEALKEKFNGDNPFSNNEVKQKIKETIFTKYQVENISQCEQIKEKIKETVLAKYGVTHISQNEQIKEQIKNSRCNATYQHKVSWIGDEIELLCSEEMFRTQFHIPYFKFQFNCKKCNTNFFDTLDNGNFPFCPKCNPHVNRSTFETSFIEFLIQNDITFIQNDRTILDGKELDIFIPEFKLAIELNGNYWHSERFKDKKYHLNKLLKCRNQNIRLIHIFEDEWFNKLEIVKSRILNLTNKTSKTIYGRNTDIRLIDNLSLSHFLKKNHLQGPINSKVSLGLYFENQLISVMSFGKPRFAKQHEWELLRFASRCDTTVVGGASKLLREFEKQFNPKSLISYADLRWSVGNLYSKLGFNLVKETSPGYFYTRGLNRINRIQLMKHKQPKLFGDNFNGQLTEVENANKNGYFRIWDCGQQVWLKEFMNL